MSKQNATNEKEMVMTVPDTYHIIDQPKQHIAQALKQKLVKENLSVRKLAEQVGMKHPQVLRITGGENYTINNLLKVLHEAGLELVIREKTEE